MTDTVATEPALRQIQGFRFGALPESRDPGTRRAEFVDAAGPAADPEAGADLGAIATFTGVFQGTGLNTIFRPQSRVTPTVLEHPASGNDDNILELNLTTETLSFSPALASIPNRGSGDVQGDVFLSGIPYMQIVNDVTDPERPVGIHVEPGIWLSVPPTQAPAEGPTLVRMASIPHGTTVVAQGTGFSVEGGPQIASVDITPFPIGGDQKTNPIRFPSQTASDAATFRLPQDLKSFIDAGTITQQILDDPNTVIRDRANRQHIVHTDVVQVSTQPAEPLFGGGTGNIAFLLGDAAAASPNADAVSMSAIFWSEVVKETITVPALSPGRAVVVQGDASVGDPVPSYSVTSATATTGPAQVEVFYTQIQYTQTVLLNFNGLSWPHVSVATLIPNSPAPVTLP